ncbi:MAG: glycogen synthase GlgA [Pseudomonadota bacterium]|uniref:glycogen synthase GlgA n=1 Tax=Burkholderiaceae TaxID=119060 RepID=UPI000781DC41|nr:MULTISPECIES: glycogen synthase GlgA [Burkholderiaceae]AMM17138.1 glycogen synthase [Burkholderia sp. PAMC 28687]MDP9156937.1 glycogen synthase GlgA [Pseudomonadota bacterium]
MSLNVLLVASEAVPLAKTGGLGDMVSAYAAALREAGVDAAILLPAYPNALQMVDGLQKVASLTGLPGGDGALYRGRMPDTGVPVILLRMDHLYARDGLYQDAKGRDYEDNAIRFASLSAAAVRLAEGVRGFKKPDIVHAHDWHSGLTPLLMKHAGVHAKSVFTIHNLAFQGNYSLSLGAALGVPAKWLVPALTEQKSIEFYGALSLMKAGIVHADHVATVSETYAREILTPRFGHLMEGVLQCYAEKLSGIINGIDVGAWDPMTDTQIARNYCFEDMRGKHACKRELQQMFGLPVDPFAPVIAIGSRMTSQKMADVVIDAIPALLEQHPRLQIAVIGKGEAHLETAFQRLAQTWPDRIGVHIGYDERRAHVLHSGADILLHGSRFEPCGLTQIYAMRYGTLPVASRVGGLADTIVDAAEASSLQEGFQSSPVESLGSFEGATSSRPATGFLFDGEATHDMVVAVTRAIHAFMRPQQWRTLQRNAMARDYGWNHAVAKYIQLYAGLTDARPAKTPLRTRRVPVHTPAVPAIAAMAAPAAAASRHDRHDGERSQFVARSA